jgi:hypothetical protein
MTRSQMIFITAKFKVLPESADRWPEGIVNVTVPQEDWSLLGEMSVDSDSGS